MLFILHNLIIIFLFIKGLKPACAYDLKHSDSINLGFNQGIDIKIYYAILRSCKCVGGQMEVQCMHHGQIAIVTYAGYKHI